MGEPATHPWIDYPAYLALERDTDTRHEWLDGRVYAMAGGSLLHSELKALVVGELLRVARACGCKVFDSDAKVRVLATGLATYPDASVVCGVVQTDPGDDHAITNPSVLVEVLSEGTEAYDREEKFAHYRRIPSLKDYVLVSQRARRVEVFSRSVDGQWLFSVAEAGETLRLTAMSGAIAVDEVYAGVGLPPPVRPRRSE